MTCLMKIKLDWEFTPAHVEILGKSINGTNTITAEEFESFLKGVVDRTVIHPITTPEPSTEEKRQMKIAKMSQRNRQSYMNGWAQVGARLAKK